MRTRHQLLAAAALSFLTVAGNAWGIVMPMELTLTPPDATFNRINMTVDLHPLQPDLGNQSRTATSDASGDCSATFNFLFDPVSHQATASEIAFNLQRPGHVALTDTHFTFTWLLIFKEYVDATNVKVSPYTPLPPTPVVGGQFAADQQAAEFNGGSLVYSGVMAGSYDLAAEPLGGQNGATTPGTIVISSPTMNGTLATYVVTAQMPLAVDETIVDPDFTARVRASGTLKTTGTFQFDFGPRTVYWAAASGDYAAGANWDTGFAPRTGDTAAVDNGGTATLATAIAGTPAAVRVGNASKLEVGGAAGRLAAGSVQVAGGAELVLSREGGNALADSTAVTNNGTLRIAQLAGGNGEAVGPLSGSGTTLVEAVGQLAAADVVQFGLVLDAGASLTADSIRADTLTIGAGAAVAIRPAVGQSAAAGAVPEPGILALLVAGGLAALLLRRFSRSLSLAARIL